MFENISDSRIELIETKKNPMTGMEYHHIHLYYSDAESLFFDGWVDDNLTPIYSKFARESGVIGEDKAYPLTKYEKVPSGTEVQIGLASEQEIGELRDLYYQYYFDGDTGPVGALAAATMKIDDEHFVWYVRANGEIVAAIYFYDGAGYGYSDMMYIDNLFVHQNYRQNGIGKALINNVAHTAKSKGYKGLVLMVMGKQNIIEDTAFFYQKQGFDFEKDMEGNPFVMPIEEDRIRVTMVGRFEE